MKNPFKEVKRLHEEIANLDIKNEGLRNQRDRLKRGPIVSWDRIATLQDALIDIRRVVTTTLDEDGSV